MFWLTLPLRMLVGLLALLLVPVGIVLVPLALLLWLPFKLLQWSLRLAVGVVVLPIIAMLALCGLLVAGIAAAAASMPLVLIGLVAFGAWMLLRRPARAW